VQFAAVPDQGKQSVAYGRRIVAMCTPQLGEAAGIDVDVLHGYLQFRGLAGHRRVEPVSRLWQHSTLTDDAM
jgi:hypothetical protein